ncbi:nucleotide exchange factor GrpE [bacterium]|nr:nucleotide exchange factor GrpE [bacterium]
MLASITLFISDGRSQDQPVDAPAQPLPVVPVTPPAGKNQGTVSNWGGEYPPASFVWSMMGIVGLLSLVTAGLAFYSIRLTKLRLNSSSGTTVSFGDSATEWMQQLERHWNRSHQQQSENATTTVSQLKEVSAAFDTQGETHFQHLYQAFTDHHKIMGSELNEMRKDLSETREILASVRKIAEEKKEELEEYKSGFRVSTSKEALGHLCDVRHNLGKVQSMLENAPAIESAALKTLKDIDWELSDTLENFDLIEIDAKPGMPIRDESLSGKHKILGTQPAPTPDDHGLIAEVIRHGYLIRVPRGDTEETLLFRPVQVSVYANQKAS